MRIRKLFQWLHDVFIRPIYLASLSSLAVFIFKPVVVTSAILAGKTSLAAFASGFFVLLPVVVSFASAVYLLSKAWNNKEERWRNIFGAGVAAAVGVGFLSLSVVSYSVPVILPFVPTINMALNVITIGVVSVACIRGFGVFKDLGNFLYGKKPSHRHQDDELLSNTSFGSSVYSDDIRDTCSKKSRELPLPDAFPPAAEETAPERKDGVLMP